MIELTIAKLLTASLLAFLFLTYIYILFPKKDKHNGRRKDRR
jgi:hypothetical protein